MKTLLDWFETVPDRHGEVVFWGGLTCVLAGLIAPLWVGITTPITDFGGHLQMVDAYVRYETLPSLSERVFLREEWLVPNLLPARLADLLTPLLSPSQSLRLFLTLVIGGLAGALLLCLKEFGRSRNLVFLCLPLCWGAMMGLGLINYVGIYPLLFVALALGRKVGQKGRPSDITFLVITTIIAFFMHGMGCLFVIGLAGVSLVLALPARGASWRLLSLTPSLGLWLFWFLNGPLSTPGHGGIGAATQQIRFQSLADKLAAFGGDTLDVLVGTADEITLGVLVAILLAWFLAQPHPVGRLKDTRRLKMFQERPLLTLFAVAFLSVLLMPTYVGTILIDTRMITPTAILLAMLPRPLASKGLTRLLGTAAAITALGFGASLTLAANLYHEREIAPLVELIETIPGNMRAECVQVGRVNTLFKRRPLSHNCNALLQTERNAFAGGGFAYTRFNAIQFKKGAGYHSLRRGDWRRSRARAHWDYIVVRGAHKAPPGGNLARIHSTRSSHANGTDWTLYQILK